MPATLSSLQKSSFESELRRDRTHKHAFELAEEWIGKPLREEVGDVEVRADELHAQLPLPDVVTTREVAVVKMFRRLCRADRVVDRLNRTLVIAVNWCWGQIVDELLGVTVRSLDHDVLALGRFLEHEVDLLQQLAQPDALVASS